MGIEQDNSYYDDLFKKSPRYRDSYKNSIYLQGWQKAIDWCTSLGKDELRILEIGCGTGQFAEMLKDNNIRSYQGFDFSSEAIEVAKKRIPNWEDKFCVSDIFASNAFNTIDYNVVCAFEVLEHINNDIDCLNRIKTGSSVIFSVPNFWDPAHVRVFKDTLDVIDRYKEIIHFDDSFVVSIPHAKWFYLKGTKI